MVWMECGVLAPVCLFDCGPDLYSVPVRTPVEHGWAGKGANKYFLLWPKGNDPNKQTIDAERNSKVAKGNELLTFCSCFGFIL